MDIRDDLKAYLDGELSPERADEVRLALDAHPELQQEMQMLKKISLSLKAAQPDPVAGKEETLRAVSRPEPRRRLRVPNYVLAAAACALVGLIILPQLRGARYEDSASAMMAPAADAPAVGGGVAGEAMNGADMAKAEMEAPASAPMPSEDSKVAAKRARGGAENDYMAMKPQAMAEGRTSTGSVPLGMAPAIIKTAEITMKVADAGQAMVDAQKFAKDVGGWAQNSNSQSADGGLGTANVTLRVPVRAYDATLEKIRGLGVKVSESSNGEDVTTQLVDTEARLKTLRQEEEQIRLILAGTRRLSEILAVRDRLNGLRQEIESMDAQRKALKDMSSYSTINCSFVEKERVLATKPEEGWANESWAGAVNLLKGIGEFLGKVFINLFVLSPIWAPVLLVGYWLSKRGKKS